MNFLNGKLSFFDAHLCAEQAMITATTEQTLRELLTTMWLDNHIELADGPDDIDDVVTVGEAAISAAFDAKPENWALRELYADWLEALGNPRCASQRWMVVNRKRPWDQRSSTRGRCWSWCRSPHDIILSGLGHELSLRLVNWKTEGAYYPTRTAAELDLHNALCKAGEITCEEVEA